jgi:hypothetical protein
MNFETAPAPAEQEESAEKKEKKELILALEARLRDLNEWQKHWTSEDRTLAEKLKAEIQQLKKETGDLSGLLDKMGL